MKMNGKSDDAKDRRKGVTFERYNFQGVREIGGAGSHLGLEIISRFNQRSCPVHIQNT